MIDISKFQKLCDRIDSSLKGKKQITPEEHGEVLDLLTQVEVESAQVLIQTRDEIQAKQELLREVDVVVDEPDDAELDEKDNNGRGNNDLRK